MILYCTRITFPETAAALQHRLCDLCLSRIHHHYGLHFLSPHPYMMTKRPVICGLRLSRLLNDSSGRTMVGKSSFDSEGVRTWSVLAFVTIIDPHTSTATMCVRNRERETSFMEGGKRGGNPRARRALRLCSMTLRTPNWEERMGKEEQMGLDSPR